MVIIFWEILMFDSILLSPQVEGSVIISNKHGIYDCLTICRMTSYWGSYKIRKYQQNLSLFLKMNIFSILEKKFWKKRNWTFFHSPIVPYLTSKQEFVSNILSVIVSCVSKFSRNFTRYFIIREPFTRCKRQFQFFSVMQSCK